MNLDFCFLSVVALPSRGWIVPVGGSTPDRLKGGATPDWLRTGSRAGSTGSRAGSVHGSDFFWFGFLCYNEGMNGAMRTGRDSFVAALTALGLVAAGLVWAASALDYKWQWGRAMSFAFKMSEDGVVWGPLAKGAVVTLQLASVSVVLAAFAGMLAAAAGMSRMASLRWLSRVYIESVRNTPLLVQLYLFYFIFANAFGMGRFAAGALALAVFEGAFAAEIFRAGMESVSRGQTDAARAMGLSRAKTWALIVVPQALPLVLPALANQFVALILHSSIVTVVAVDDLTNAARNLVAETFLVYELWFAAAGFYIAVAFGLSRLIGWWEKRLPGSRAAMREGGRAQ